MRVCFYTLGCKVNLNETGALEQLFRANGFTIAQEGEAADVFIVNSCTVTNFGDQKSRKWLRRKKAREPGCGDGADRLLPAGFPGGSRTVYGSRPCVRQRRPQGYSGQRTKAAGRPRAHRSYCPAPARRAVRGAAGGAVRDPHPRLYQGRGRLQPAVRLLRHPRARGPVRSRAEESILAELHQLATAGYREVVLSAISLPSYGLDTGTNLVELVEKCAQVPGIERIRLGSLDPDMLTPEFISRLAAVDKLCPQFHLSLQSGCTATLRRMRRVYTAQEYAQVVEQIRAAYGSRPVSFTTDCICGFPGETAEDFEESCAFLKKIGFVKVHVFPYSRRSGTPAYDFPDQIHEREKQERSRRMNAVAEQVRCEALAAFEGTEDEVLLETPLSGTLFTGYTRLYIPVVVSAPGCESGQIVRVKLDRYDGERVRAALC